MFIKKKTFKYIVQYLGMNTLRLAFVCLCNVVCGGGAPGF